VPPGVPEPRRRGTRLNVPEHRIEIHAALVPLPLDVAVGAIRLLDARVAELILDPPGTRARLEHDVVGGMVCVIDVAGITYSPR
jgi:hypothetical protein